MASPNKVDPRFASVNTIFFVIGAQKSGTTWVQRYFSSHPEVCVPVWKEQNYWRVVDVNQPISGNLQSAKRDGSVWRSSNWLLRYRSPKRHRKIQAAMRAIKACQNAGMPHKQYADTLFYLRDETTKAVGEICPQYALLSESAYQQMTALGENVRFVFIMRDPAKRFISAVKHRLRSVHSAGNLDRSILIEKILKTIEDRASSVMQRSHYHETIARLEKVVPQDRIAYVFFEELFEQGKVDAICDFLGVSRRPANFEKVVNPDHTPELQLTAEEYAGVVDKLSDIYDAIFDKLGDRVPGAWRRSYERRELAYAE